MKTKYLRIDCDNVGDKIELMLYNKQIGKAQLLNNLIRQSIIELSERLKIEMNAETLLIGPDDLLIKIEENKIDLNLINNIREDFYNKTGFSISVGIGKTVIESMRNLDIAKKSGRNRIYG